MATLHPHSLARREAAAAAAGEGRPAEMEGWSNRRIYHPLAGHLAAALRNTPVTPNMVSVASGLCVLGAGACYLGLPWPLSAAAGLSIHLLWHVVDGADGALARLTGRSSPVGELVDGVCDYAGHLILYTALGLSMVPAIGAWGVIVPLLAGLSRVAQSNHAESRRRIYKWRVYGIPWLQQAESGKDELFRRPNLFARIFSPFATGYLALSRALSPPVPAIDEAIERAAPGAEKRRVMSLCRRAARRPLRLQIWLGANPRTLLLGLSVAAGSPLYFFLIESTLLNLLLLWSIAEQRRCDARLAARLA